MTETLYARLGGAEGVATIAAGVVERHMSNPDIKARFVDSDPERLKVLVAQFFSMGTGGPTAYDGRSMPETHKGMNINELELVSSIDDVLASVRASGADETACNDVLAILYSLKGEVLGQ